VRAGNGPGLKLLLLMSPPWRLLRWPPSPSPSIADSKRFLACGVLT
jgi:hypothetical protein